MPVILWDIYRYRYHYRYCVFQSNQYRYRYPKNTCIYLHGYQSPISTLGEAITTFGYRRNFLLPHIYFFNIMLSATATNPNVFFNYKWRGANSQLSASFHSYTRDSKQHDISGTTDFWGRGILQKKLFFKT